MMVSFQGDDGGHHAHSDLGDEESDEVSKNKIKGGDSSSSIDGGLVPVMKLKQMTESASQKHALSERKRRKRINAHYDSLQKFFPRLLKTDKASVLSETVRRLKELKNMIADIEPSHEDGDWCSCNRSRQSFFIPGENDEVTVSYCDGCDKTTVRAIICCEERPDLNQGLMEAVQSVRGKAVKAEMATVGGRTKAEVMVEWAECGGGGAEDVGMLRRALRAVVENRVHGRTGLMGPGSNEPKLIGLGSRFVDGRRPNVYDQIENGYAELLMD